MPIEFIWFFYKELLDFAHVGKKSSWSDCKYRVTANTEKNHVFGFSGHNLLI